MSDKTVLVATYGSLRRGMGNFRVNLRAGGEFVGTGKTMEHFDLFEYCYGFPSVSLTHNSAGKPVTVDVFATTQDGLEGAYDGLEGHHGNDNPHTFYKRSKVKVQMDNGNLVDAWMYHIDEETGPVVEHGDWCVHKNGEQYYDEFPKA